MKQIIRRIIGLFVKKNPVLSVKDRSVKALKSFHDAVKDLEGVNQDIEKEKAERQKAIDQLQEQMVSLGEVGTKNNVTLEKIKAILE